MRYINSLGRVLFFILCLWSANVFAGDDSNDSDSAEGKFTLIFEEPSNDKFQDIADEIADKDEFQKIVDRLNEVLTLPYDIDIIFKNDKMISPYYDPNTHQIVMTYEWLQLTKVLYKKISVKDDGSDPTYIKDYLINVNTFILYHEIGHALIHAYNLPVLGQNEDASDNLAAVFSLVFEEKDYDVLLDAADFFDLLDRIKDEKSESAYWDEHALDSQRYYRIICLAYGKHPDEVEKELKNYDDDDINKFIEEKGERCKYEVKKDLATWINLLKPHLRDSEDFSEAAETSDNSDD